MGRRHPANKIPAGSTSAHDAQRRPAGHDQRAHARGIQKVRQITEFSLQHIQIRKPWLAVSPQIKSVCTGAGGGDTGGYIAFNMILRFIVTCLAASVPVFADPAKAPPAVHAGNLSPVVAPDRQVTFHFNAPNAREVKVSGEFGADVVLAKDDKGMWNGSTGPVKPGVHEYRVKVDGLSVIDSGNPWVKPQRWPSASILHIPSDPPAPWDLQDIPHGTVHAHDYFSGVLARWRHVVVYTPPGYAKGTEALPVLYLSHGFSDNEGSWTVHGKAHWIMDRLIADGKAVPMLIVMPDAHALPPGPGWKDEYADKNTDAFCRELVAEVAPLVESSYRVKADPAHRAFAGLSMGGRHALVVALEHNDFFSQVGAFSSAPPAEATIAKGTGDAAGTNGRLKLLWIACGKDDFLFQKNQEFDAILTAKNINHEYAVTAGNHSWPVWRNYLVEFAPRLFR